MTPAEIAEQFARDVAASIQAADQDASGAAAAFSAGHFDQYWKIRSEQVFKRLEAAGGDAIAHAGGS